MLYLGHIPVPLNINKSLTLGGLGDSANISGQFDLLGYGTKIQPESSKGLKFGPPKNHQNQTWGLEFDTLGPWRV